MKVIDLLNKIANGEEVPKEIKYNNINYYWCNQCKIYERIEDRRKDLYNDLDNLNDEVEIIEDTPKEDKKIEKLTTYFGIEPVSFEHPRTFEENAKYIDFNAEQFFNKINEIIDKVNGEDNE